MTDSPEQQAEQTLADAASNAATIAEGMGQLVTARRTLIDGGFAPEVADGIIITALQAATR